MEYFKLNVDGTDYSLPSEEQELTLYHFLISISAVVNNLSFQDMENYLNEYILEQSYCKFDGQIWHCLVLVQLQTDLMPQLPKYHFLRLLYKFAIQEQYLPVFKNVLINDFEDTSKLFLQMYSTYMQDYFIKDYIEFRYSEIEGTSEIQTRLLNFFIEETDLRSSYKTIIDKNIEQITSKEQHNYLQVN